MEPVSILSAAAAISAVAGKAWELGSFVRELYQGAKTVDGRVRRLESAVTELARACEHVQGQFESMSSDSSYETPALAWDEQGALTASIESQVKDCRRTLKELRRLLIDLRPSGSSFFGRTSRHVKLQDRGQQISDFSMRIKTHTDTLQMSLQIVIIKIALATPDFLLRQLGTALEDLRVRLSRIENNSNPSDSRARVGDGHEAQFLEHAREALRSGTTLYEASTAGSIAEVTPATDNERATRIKEWANSVGALRGTYNDNSGVTRPDTVSAQARAEKNLVEEVVEVSSHASAPEASANSLSDCQSVSGSDADSVALSKANHGISPFCDDERSSVTGSLASKSSSRTHFSAIDGPNHVTVDKNEDTTLQPPVVPGSSYVETASPHISSRNSYSIRTKPSLSHESLVNRTDSEQTVDNCIVSGQDALAPAEARMGETHNANHITFKYPMDNSLPLDRTARRELIKSWDIRIKGKVEALICTGDHIESTVLSELFAADQTASTAPSSITPSDPQQGSNGLALLLAVYFRDVYLIKPLIELGYSPNARVQRHWLPHNMPITAAVAARCPSVIQELLVNGAKSPITCEQSPTSCTPSPWFALLHPNNLRRFPPTGIKSITDVIDLLMPKSRMDGVGCACPLNADDDNGTCHWWTILLQIRRMPAELSDYQVPLVAYFLEYIVTKDASTRYTADSPLCNAIHLQFFSTVDFLVEAVEESTLKAWLRKKNSDGLTPLFEAMLDRKVPLKVIRTLLDKGANLGSFRWAQLGLFRITQKQTARQFALESGRRDLIALVKEYDRKLRVRSA